MGPAINGRAEPEVKMLAGSGVLSSYTLRYDYVSYSPPVLQLIVKRRAGGHGTSLKKVTCARIRSHLSHMH
jgi:hypothetical protein